MSARKGAIPRSFRMSWRPGGLSLLLLRSGRPFRGCILYGTSAVASVGRRLVDVPLTTWPALDRMRHDGLCRVFIFFLFFFFVLFLSFSCLFLLFFHSFKILLSLCADVKDVTK